MASAFWKAVGAKVIDAVLETAVTNPKTSNKVVAVFKLKSDVDEFKMWVEQHVKATDIPIVQAYYETIKNDFKDVL